MQVYMTDDELDGLFEHDLDRRYVDIYPDRLYVSKDDIPTYKLSVFDGKAYTKNKAKEVFRHRKNS